MTAWMLVWRLAMIVIAMVVWMVNMFDEYSDADDEFMVRR